MQRVRAVVMCSLVLAACSSASGQSVGVRGRLEGERGGSPAPRPETPEVIKPQPSASPTRRPPSENSKLSARARLAIFQTRRLAGLKPRHRRRNALRLTRMLGRDPELLRELLEDATPEEASLVAESVLPDYMALPRTYPEFATYDNFVRSVMLMEAIDPEASPEDIARLLRRHFYADNLFEVQGVKISQGDPQVNAALKRVDQRLTNLKPWQEVPGVMGRRFPRAETDVAHALVGLDAYAARRREGGLLGGRVRGQFDSILFTEVGDVVTDIFSRVGLKEAGNYNAPDGNGNQLGRDLIRAWNSGSSPALSDMLKRYAKNSRL